MADLEAIAAQLREAYDGIPVAPVAGGLTADDACEIQHIQTRRGLSEGTRIAGQKAGLTLR